MSMRLAFLLVFCIVLAGCASAPSRDASVDALMKRYDGDGPGASLLVIRDGVPLVQRGYGFADLEHRVAASPQTDYRLASVSKQFTATAILLLAQDGKLSLDDRARRWLPSLPAAAGAITLRQLLSHQGGLIDYEDIMAADTRVPLRDKDVLALLAKTDHLYFAPGTSYRYSNGGYAMLALIVERASGMPFQDFLRQRIFLPLGMTSTLAYVTEGPPVPHRAFGYSAESGQWIRTDQSMTSSVLGDGGIYSSIDDLARWDAALYDNRLLSDASRKAAFTPWTATDDPTVEYGYGWRITGETLWHSGETIGFRNVIVRYPKRHLTVVLLTNRTAPEPYRTALAIGDLFR
jgi:CubicO group peptidase (beta-lactamase class C family)